MAHGLSSRKESAPCFDAGSRYCPCELAVLGQCVACSLLRGEDTCRCGWSGVCVSSQFIFNGSKATLGRTSHRVSLIEREEPLLSAGTPKAFFMSLAVPREVAMWSVFPGSFVLVRPEGTPERWNVPLCVTAVKESSLEVMMEVQGPKTTAIDRKASSGSLLALTGPFWSGIPGMEHLRRFGAGSVLAVAKGVGQATVLQVAEYIRHRGGRLEALIGPGPLGSTFAVEPLVETGASVEIMPREKDHNLGRIAEELSSGHHELLLSCGSDDQHRGLIDLLRKMEAPPRFAWSSNLTMTCAEGICGSCLVQGFRGCKAHIPERVVWDM